jgi:hypothetical protein
MTENISKLMKDVGVMKKNILNDEKNLTASLNLLNENLSAPGLLSNKV